jgi:glycerophosphoryl diester phosphodiesterase
MQLAIDLTVAIGGAAAVLWLLYLLLISPHNGDHAAAFRGKRIAHRGLHGGKVVENTLPAFRKATEHGYGVELDVQLSSDGEVVVCHDYDLKRVFGLDRKVKELTQAELSALGVPTLAEVLSVLDETLPLVVELKGENGDVSVCQKTAEVLDAYQGLYCIESFNPLYLRWFKKNRSDVVRGQLSTRFTKKNRAGSGVLNFALRHLLLNVLGAPHFIAYDHRYADSVSLRICRRLGAMTVGWTPMGEEEIARAEENFDAVIFELTPEELP